VGAGRGGGAGPGGAEGGRTIFLATAITAQLADWPRSTLGESIALMPASISPIESTPVRSRSHESMTARVSRPPGRMAFRIDAWFSGERSHRACEPPAALCSLVESIFCDCLSKRYWIGTELGTCRCGISSSPTSSK
jgi:hypothetical protein